MPELRVGGVTPLSMLDYPGELSAVVFCQGCPWRCRYCHNAHLLESGSPRLLAWQALLHWLERRSGLLDAVVFSGGEPTAQTALVAAMQQVRDLGFKVGLHTSGAYPRRLARVLPLVDWVGLDIKALAQDYPQLTGVPDSGRRAWQSLRITQAADVSCTVRVTVHEALLPQQKRIRLARELRAAGVFEPEWQACRSDSMLDPSLGPNGYLPQCGHSTAA